MPKHWYAEDAAWVGPVEPGELQVTIAKKDGLVSAYLRKCDEAWLPFVIGGETAASTTQADARVSSHMFTSQFRRVIVLDYQFDRYFELRTEPPEFRT
jgi:hypothetical protein